MAGFRRVLFVLFMLACGAAVLVAWEDPCPRYRIYSRCWREYEADSQALGLFHMEHSVDALMGEEEMGALMEAPTEEEGLGAGQPGQLAGKESAEVEGEGEKLDDSSWQPAAAAVARPFEWRPEDGRFGGGIQLGGGSSAIVTPSYNDFGQKGSFAVEAWFRPDHLSGVLFSVPGSEGGFVLRLTDEGALEASYADVTVRTDAGTLRKGRWTHVALVATPNSAQLRYLYGLQDKGVKGKPIPSSEGRFTTTPEEHPPELRIVVGGRIAVRHADGGLPRRVRALAGKILVGNDEDRGEPYRGRIDELRVSKQARRYYPNNMDLMQGTAGPDFPVGQPIMRDRREQAYHVPLDRDLRARDGDSAPAAKGYPAGKEVAFETGVHGRSVQAGPEAQTPAYEFSNALSARSATLAFWFSPLDWDNGRRRLKPEGNAEQRVVRYRPDHMPYEVVPLVGLSSSRPGSETERWLFNVSAQGMWTAKHGHKPSQPPSRPLVPGTWYHVAVVIDHGQVRFYLNGQPLEGYLFDIRTRAAPADHTLHRLVFGPGHPWKHHRAFSEKKHTVVDEVRLYSRPLTPVEIRNAYARYRPGKQAEPLPFAYVDVDLDPVYRRVATDVTLLGAERDGVERVHVELTDGADEVHLDTALPAPADGRTWLVSDGVFVPTDSYSVRCRFSDAAGKELSERTFQLQRPEFDPHRTPEQPPFDLAHYPSMGKVRVRFKPIWEMSTIRSDFLSTPDGGFGLRGEYYEDSACMGEPVISRIDPQVGFTWKGSPGHNVAPDYFGAVWTGTLGPVPYDGDYLLRTVAGSQARLWIDGKAVIDTSTGEGEAARTARLTLKAGSRHDLRLQYGAGGGTSKCLLQWRLAERPPQDKQDPAQVKIIAPDGEALLDRPVQISRWCEQLLETGDLPDGTYRVEVKAPGGRRFYPRWFERKHFVFEGNRMGVTDRVYPPFEPIEVEDNEVRVVMRRYGKSGLGLWDSVRARGNETPMKELLAAPIRLVADGEPLEGDGKFTSVAGHEVVYEGTAAHPAVSVATRTITEYDGCMRVELTLSPPDTRHPTRDTPASAPDTPAPTLDTLHLEVPLKDELAPLWHVVRTGIRGNPAGYAPKGTGRVWDSRRFRDGSLPGNFLPYIWLGAEERGLCWFADNERGWGLGDPKNDPCLSLYREDGVLTLRVHLVQKPVEIQEERRIVFGLMASPGKPMPENWRRYMFNRGEGRFKSIGWSGSTYWGCAETMKETYPLDADFDVLNKFQEVRLTGSTAGTNVFKKAWRRRHLEDYEPKGRKEPSQVMSLVDHMIGQSRHQPDYRNVYWEEFFSVSWHHPETRQFLNEWYGDDRFGFRPSESYIDFQCWYGAEFIRRGIGLYFDNTFPKAASNPFLSTAYRDEEGKIHHSARMWWHREYLKRIWVLHQQLAPAATRPIMMFHMTNSHMVPYMTHGQTNLDLEWKYGPAPAQRKFSADLLRAETLGLQTGNIPLALTDTERLNKKPAPAAQVEQAERTYFGVLAVHEVRFRYGGISRKLMDFLLDFGYARDNCEIYNYWAADPPVKIDDERCKWLLLERDGKLMLLLVTWRRKPGEVTVQIDYDRLGVEPRKVIDVEYPKRDEVSGAMDDLLAMGGEEEDSPAPEVEPAKRLTHSGSEWQGPVKLDPATGELTVSLTGYGVRVLRIQ